MSFARGKEYQRLLARKPLTSASTVEVVTLDFLPPTFPSTSSTRGPTTKLRNTRRVTDRIARAGRLTGPIPAWRRRVLGATAFTALKERHNLSSLLLCYQHPHLAFQC